MNVKLGSYVINRNACFVMIIYRLSHTILQRRTEISCHTLLYAISFGSFGA